MEMKELLGNCNCNDDYKKIRKKINNFNFYRVFRHNSLYVYILKFLGANKALREKSVHKE